MSTTPSENKNFYWHCQVAALLLQSFPRQNAATRAHARNAIRMATLAATGKYGIPYATKGAHEKRAISARNWHELGLIREHVFPVSQVYDKVVSETSSRYAPSWAEISGSLTQDDMANWNVPAATSEPAPLSARIARIVRDHSVLAWITHEEDALLRKNGLGKAMPANYQGDDLHARYHVCGIELIKL